MVNSVHAKLSVVRQCILLKVARSSLYYEKTGESGINLTLMQEIDRAFTEWPFLGVRQMCRYLVSLGYGVGRKRVRRLMRLMGLATEGAERVVGTVKVSIHALARRTTARYAGHPGQSGCFNPRPRAEGDVLALGGALLAAWFQSTPSHGGRRVRGQLYADLADVSIHALARRATRRSS